MNAARYTQLKELFAKAAEMPPGERTAYLEAAAGSDEQLRREVEALLRHHDEPTSTVPSSAFEKSAAASSGARSRSASQLPLQPRKPEPPPPKIGPYRIVREIGRGGMGMVYLGVREEGRFQKRVAIKVIKKGLDSDDVLRRFELERQLLSALNHPNIARLFDGGTTEDGRPYFALEYIEGTHLDQYADRRRLTVDERLKLFKQVCAAVAHAHRNLVVHRDLKPANILVTEDGTVKLMDFGIAKLLNPELSLIAGDPTARDMRVMTPEYASPEQVRGETITTASDVYSLGVLLYELLSGHRPYRLRERLRTEIERVICEQEPERPSTAISKIEEVPNRGGISAESFGPSGSPSQTTRTVTPESVSATRGVRPEALRRRLAGDIDNIILKAMRKEPQRRYTSVERFAEDIDRHMSGMPVTARPSSFVYRSSKFVRRNKAGVAIAALIAVSTAAILGIAMTAQTSAANLARANEAAMLRDLEMERADAEQARAAEQEMLRRLAEERARAEEAQRLEYEALAVTRAGSIRLLAKGLIHDLNFAIQQLEGATLARQLLVTTALSFLKDIEKDQGAEHDPSLALELAAAYYQVGDVQAGLRNPNLGDVAGALESYTKALDLRLLAADFDPDYRQDRRFRIDLVHNYGRLGDLHRQSGLPASEMYQRQFDLAAELFAEEPDDLDLRLVMATALENSGASHVQQGRHAEALEAYLRAYEHYDAVRAANPDQTNLIRNVAILQLRIAARFHASCDFNEAAQWAGQSLALREQLAAPDPLNARFRRDVAVMRRFMGRYVLDAGDFDGARANFIASRDDFVHLADADPHDTRVQRDRATSYEEIGSWHYRAGEIDAAMESFTRFNALVAPLANRDPDDAIIAADLARSHHHLGTVLQRRGDHAQAIRRHRDAIEITTRLLNANPDHVERQEDLARQHAGLARALMGSNMLSEAARSLQQAREIYGNLLERMPHSCHLRASLAGVIAQQARLAALRGDAAQCIDLADHGIEIASIVPAATPPLLYAKALGLRLRGDKAASHDALAAALAVLEANSRLDVDEGELLDTIRAELNR